MVWRIFDTLVGAWYSDYRLRGNPQGALVGSGLDQHGYLPRVCGDAEAKGYPVQ